MRPERALRFLDTVDGIAYAARLACAGHRGRQLRRALFALVLCLSPALLLLKS